MADVENLNLPASITGKSQPAYPDARDFVGEAEESRSSLEALGILNEGIDKGSSSQFPSNLGARKVVFKVIPRNRGKQTDRTTSSAKDIVGLPLPSNLSTGYGAQYTDVSLGVLGQRSVEAGAAFGAGGFQSAIDTVQNNGINTLSEAAKSIAASASSELGAIVGGLVLGTTGFGVGAALTQIAPGALSGANIAVNPHMAVLFEGVNFRNHSFQYKFSPRDKSESDSLKKIIKIFKKAMHPSIDRGKMAFFQYPDEFEIDFPNDGGYLFDVGKSVLRDFQINYTPDGGSYFHQNGAPVAISMSMQFTEIDVLTKTEIEDGR